MLNLTHVPNTFWLLCITRPWLSFTTDTNLTQRN